MKNPASNLIQTELQFEANNIDEAEVNPPVLESWEIVSSAFRVSKEEIAQGYVVCPCGKYAHVTDHRILGNLPRGYCCEVCQECNMLMLPIECLQNAKVES